MTFGKHDADNDSQRSGNCPKCDCPMHWTANMGLVNHETDSLACKDNQIERLRHQLAAVTKERDAWIAVTGCAGMTPVEAGEHLEALEQKQFLKVQELLQRLIAVAAQRDRAWASCRAVVDRCEGLRVASFSMRDAWRQCQAVVTEAENVQITTKVETP